MFVVSLYFVLKSVQIISVVFLLSVLTFHSCEQDLTTSLMDISFVSLKHNSLGGVPCLSGAWNNKSQPLLWFWHTWHGTERSTGWNARLISFDTHTEVGPLRQRGTRRHKQNESQIFKKELDSMHYGSLFYLRNRGVLRWRRFRIQWQWVIPVVCVCQSALRGCCSTLCASTWTSSLQVSGNAFHTHRNWLSHLWSNICIFRVQILEHLYAIMAQKQLREFFLFTWTVDAVFFAKSYSRSQNQLISVTWENALFVRL